MLQFMSQTYSAVKTVTRSIFNILLRIYANKNICFHRSAIYGYRWLKKSHVTTRSALAHRTYSQAGLILNKRFMLMFQVCADYLSGTDHQLFLLHFIILLFGSIAIAGGKYTFLSFFFSHRN